MEGLRKINILGRERLVYFGMPAVEYVMQKIEPSKFKDLGEGKVETKDVKLVAHFIYAGLMGACEMRDEPLDFTYSDVYVEAERLVLSGESPEDLQAVGQSFSESTTFKHLIKFTGSKKKAKPQKLTGAR